MEKPSLQIGSGNWSIKEDELLGYRRVGNNYSPQPITMTRESAGTRVNPEGLVETVELLGSELVTNGDFSNGTTDWTVSNGTISIDNDRLKIDGISGATAEQTVTAVIGKTYKVTYTFTLGTATSGALIITGGNYPTLNAPQGTNTFYTTATQTNLRVRPRIGSDGTMFVDNVSVKESTKNNLARVDYDGTASSLLVEPLRTNLYINSEPTANEGAAANITYESFSWDIGFNNCVVFGDNSALRYRYGSTVTNGTEYTLSAYILMDDNSEPVVSNDTLSGDFSLNIGNAIGGGTINASVSMGNNIWRVSKTKVSAQTTSNNGIIKYTGQSSKGFRVVGWQTEVGSYATSYIPTDGGTVTRVQDQYSKTGISNLINSTEGVLFVEASTFENGADCRITLSDGTITNRVSIEWDILANTIKGFVGSDGNLVSPATYNQTDSNKIALKYKENNCALWINGDEVDTDFSVSALSGVNQLEFSNYGGTVPFEGKVKQLQVFKTALTDDELTILTGTSGVHFFPSYASMASALTYTIE